MLFGYLLIFHKRVSICEKFNNNIALNFRKSHKSGVVC